VGSAITRLGAASIPAIFGMGWLVFSRLVGQISSDGSFALWHILAPATTVSDFVDHRFLCFAGGYTSHPPSDFLYGWD